MIDIERLAAGLAANLLKDAAAPATPRALIEDAFRRGLRLGLSIRHPFGLHPSGMEALRKDRGPWTTTH